MASWSKNSWKTVAKRGASVERDGHGQGRQRVKPIAVVVDDLIQHGYLYLRTEPQGRNFHAGFAPQLSPEELLALGVFGGKYMTDCRSEFQDNWYEKAKLCSDAHRAYDSRGM